MILQERLECHDVENVSFGVPPVARGCTPVATSTLRQLICAASDFQQRTAWVAARLSAQSVSNRGVEATFSYQPPLPSFSCICQTRLSQTRIPVLHMQERTLMSLNQPPLRLHRRLLLL